MAKIGHNKPPVGEELLVIVQEQRAIELEMEKKEEELAVLKEKHKQYAEEILPEKMEEIGITEFKTPEGLKVKVKEEIRAHITKENKPKSHDWLEKNGHGGIIKMNVMVPFSKGEYEKARELVKILETSHDRLSTVDRSVHHQTLLAFIKEQLADGKDIPIDVFGILKQRVAKIKE